MPRNNTHSEALYYNYTIEPDFERPNVASCYASTYPIRKNRLQNSKFDLPNSLYLTIVSKPVV